MKKTLLTLLALVLALTLILASCAKTDDGQNEVTEDPTIEATEVVTEAITEDVVEETATEAVTEAVEVTEEPTEAIVEETVIEEPIEDVDFVDPAENTRYPILFIERTETVLAINGVVDDTWGSPVYTLTRDNADRNAGGLRDESAAVIYARYDADNFYVAVQSTEDSDHVCPTEPEMYMGECIQVAWYVADDGMYNPASGASKGRTEIGVSASPDFSEQYGYKWTPIAGAKSGSLEKSTHMTKKDGNTVTYMVVTPWSEIVPEGAVKPTTGNTIGFALALITSNFNGKGFTGVMGLELGRSIIVDKDNRALAITNLVDIGEGAEAIMPVIAE